MLINGRCLASCSKMSIPQGETILDLHPNILINYCLLPNGRRYRSWGRVNTVTFTCLNVFMLLMSRQVKPV